MKKIITLISTFILALFLSACDFGITKDKDVVTFFGYEDIYYEIGDEVPNYRKGIYVYANNDVSLTSLLTYDDSSVDLTSEGTYPLVYRVVYQKNVYSQEVKVIVSLKNHHYEVTFDNVGDIKLRDNVLSYDFLNNKYAYYGNQNISDLLDVDDSNVIFGVIGSYSIRYYLTYEDVLYEKVVTVTIVSVNDSKEDLLLSTYYINDLHGAILESSSSIGLPKMANLINKHYKDNADEVLFIAGGDILQGQLISNYFKGASTIDALNHMHLDAFVVGNHEFDWGFETVLNYFNGVNDLQANYPLLGANVLLKETGEMPLGITPYTIVNKGDYKVAIIGVIDELESSISYEFIKDYYFSDPVSTVRKYAKEVKELGADMVIVAIHGYNDYFNEQVSSFSGDEKIDLIFNGHTHQYVNKKVNQIPVIQTAANGNYIAKVDYRLQENKISLNKINLYSRNDHQDLTNDDIVVKDIINEYYLIIEEMQTRTLLTSLGNYSTEELTSYVAMLMRLKYNADLGFHNYGGTRTYISKNQAITAALIYQILPFDNQIITMEMTGKDIKKISLSYNGYSLDPLVASSIDNLNNNKYYTIVMHSYIYGDGSYYPNAINIKYRDEDIQALFLEVVYNLSEVQSTFTINDYLITDVILYDDEIRKYLN